MLEENKKLLLVDLCARLPYRVICRQNAISVDGEPFTIDRHVSIIQLEKCISLDDVEVPFRPYLRPMSSMTEEEQKECRKTKIRVAIQWDDYNNPIGFELMSTFKTFDWLNAHHFDYRGLIKKGLALEAPEGMYENK